MGKRRIQSRSAGKSLRPRASKEASAAAIEAKDAARERRITSHAPSGAARSPSQAPHSLRDVSREADDIAEAPHARDTDHHLDHTFFDSHNSEAYGSAWEDEHPAAPMSASARRAMFATLVLTAVFAVGLGGFALYSYWWMPQPAELGGAGAELMLPEPMPVAPTESTPPTGVAAVPAPAVPAPAGQVPAGQVPAGQVPAASAVEPPVVTAPGSEPTESTVLRGGTEGESARRYGELLSAGNALQKRGNAAAALAAYRQALELRPTGALALSRIAYLHLNRGQNKDAQDFAARAVAADPTSSEGWIVLGASRESLGDRAGAVVAYKRCAEIGTGSYVTECRRLAR